MFSRNIPLAGSEDREHLVVELKRTNVKSTAALPRSRATILFGADRSALLRAAGPLADAQDGQCLYCRGRVDSGEINHFVPWSRYPRDLAHNLVLAHRECNRRKSDLLAAEVHLDGWLLRNQTHGAAIGEAGRGANIIVDPAGTASVAGWAYALGASLHAATWLRGEQVEPLSGRWQSLLAEYG